MKEFEKIEKSLAYNITFLSGASIFAVILSSYFITSFPYIIRQALFIPGLFIISSLCVLTTWKTYLMHNRLPHRETVLFCSLAILFFMLTSIYMIKFIDVLQAQ